VLVVTADNQSRVYGVANPVLTGTLSGLQNGDPITDNYTCAATVTSSVGGYAIVPSLVDPGGNWSITS